MARGIFSCHPYFRRGTLLTTAKQFILATDGILTLWILTGKHRLFLLSGVDVGTFRFRLDQNSGTFDDKKKNPARLARLQF